MNEWEGRLAAIGSVVVLLGAYDVFRGTQSTPVIKEAVQEQREGDEEAAEQKQRKLRGLKLGYLLVSTHSY